MSAAPPSSRSGPLALGLAALALLTDAHGYCRTTTSPAQPDPTVCPARGVPIAWPTRCGAMRLSPIERPPNLDWSVVQSATRDAAAAWRGIDCGGGRPSGFDLEILGDVAAAAGYNVDGVNINSINFLSRWADDAFHPPDAAAVTIVTFGAMSASILDTDTDLNLADFRFVVGADRTGADLQTILGHEMGHALGLAHSPDRLSVMWYAVGRGEQRRAPTSDDVAGLCAVYPPRPREACDPEIRRETFYGGGLPLACASGPRAGGSGGAAVCLGAALWLSARRRRAALSGRR